RDPGVERHGVAAVGRGGVDGVVAVTAGEGEGVVARAADQHVIALPAPQRVGAAAAIQRVGLVATGQRVVATAAVDRRGRAVDAVDPHAGVVAGDGRDALLKVGDLDVGPDRVVAHIDLRGVRPLARLLDDHRIRALDDVGVVADAADQLVAGATIARERVLAGLAVQRVGAAPADDRVVAAPAVNDVAEVVSGDRVVAAAGREIADLRDLLIVVEHRVVDIALRVGLLDEGPGVTDLDARGEHREQ